MAVAAVLAVFAFARLYLSVDHPLDILVGLALGVAIPLAAFRLFTPNEAVPVAYRRGKTAHLDVTGKRGEAIRKAVHAGVGLAVLAIGMLVVAGGTVPGWERSLFDGVNGLPGWLYAPLGRSSSWAPFLSGRPSPSPRPSPANSGWRWPCCSPPPPSW